MSTTIHARRCNLLSNRSLPFLQTVSLHAVCTQQLRANRPTGTSAVLNSQPFLVPSDSSSTQPYVSSRITKGRLPVESRPEAGSVSLSTLHTPTSAASVSQPPNASLLTPSQQFLEAFPERHVDAGPVLERSPSGRLPPAYGEQLVNI